MNRQIKFRGKRVDNGEWVFGTPVFYRDGYVAIYDGLLMLYGAEATTLSRNEVDPATVGQFTGCNDYLCAEIYECDVILYDETLYLVVYDTDYFGFVLKRICAEYDKPEYVTGDEVHSCKCRVIGNNTDNHDLLKGGTE